MNRLISGAKTIIGRLFGVHLLENDASGEGFGTVQSMLEGLCLRLALATGLAFYWGNDQFREGIEICIDAVIGTIARGA